MALGGRLVIAAAYAGAMSSVRTDLFLAPCKGMQHDEPNAESDEMISLIIPAWLLSCTWQYVAS